MTVRRAQALGISRNHLREIGLLDRRLSRVYGVDGTLSDINASNLVALLRDNRSQASTELTQPDNRIFVSHISILLETRRIGMHQAVHLTRVFF